MNAMALIFFSLVLIFLQLPPFGGSPPEKPKIESPVKGWWRVSYFATPPTRYESAGKGVIKAESLGSRSSLYKEIDEKEGVLSVLHWRWKISNVVRSAIETKKDRHDAAARVMVVFGSRPLLLPLEGTEPSGFRIDYIWANHLPRNQVFDHPGKERCRIFVLQSGESKVGQWVEERRAIRKDFETAFGREPPNVMAIGIETDTDHSNEKVTAYYSIPLLKKK